MRDLLKDKQRNGRVIEWLSPERGIFKIINASIVANLWSMLKSNKVGMKYANMARGIRLIIIIIFNFQSERPIRAKALDVSLF